MSIPFTQFLMPDGRQKSVEIDRPPEIEQMARRLIEMGFWFEIEMLPTGEIHMECLDGEGEGDFCTGEICANGPDVLACVDKLVSDAAIAACGKGGK